jgi:hypothetical protein
MAVPAYKHTNEALAFITLYKAMRPEIKEEVKEMIVQEVDENELSTDMMTAISLDTFKDIWDAKENDQWDDFIKKRLECTKKEI